MFDTSQSQVAVGSVPNGYARDTNNVTKRDRPADLGERLDALYGARPASEIVERAIASLFPERIAAISSFGAESAVLLALVADVAPGTPVLFLDTGKLFPETIQYLDQLQQCLDLGDIIKVTPNPERLAAEDPDGTLWQRDPDACCALRKSEPLFKALIPYDAWLTGRKRFQTADRAAMPVFELNQHGVRINPLATWSATDIHDFMTARDLPVHPLVPEGYPSIGCAPCTTPVGSGEDARAGRWRGAAKVECGIHAEVDAHGNNVGFSRRATALEDAK